MLELVWQNNSKETAKDQTNSITIQEERKRGKHLSREERNMIKVLHRQGCTLRAMSKYVGCTHTTVYYELKRGTASKKSARGRQPVYTAKRGLATYDEHRKNCRRPLKLNTVVVETFIQEKRYVKINHYAYPFVPVPALVYHFQSYTPGGSPAGCGTRESLYNYRSKHGHDI